MAEQPLPLAATVTEVLPLGRLIAAGNAAGVSLGGVHSRTPFLEWAALGLVWGALARTALWALAVRRHRSSVGRSAIECAYHVTTV